MNRIAMMNANVSASRPLSMSPLSGRRRWCDSRDRTNHHRRATHGDHLDGRPCRDRVVRLGHGEPGLTRKPDVARVEVVADVVDRKRTLAHEPAVDTRCQWVLVPAM